MESDLRFGVGRKVPALAPVHCPHVAWLAGLPAPSPMTVALIQGQVSTKLLFAAGRSRDQPRWRDKGAGKGGSRACRGEMRDLHSALCPVSSTPRLTWGTLLLPPRIHSCVHSLPECHLHLSHDHTSCNFLPCQPCPSLTSGWLQDHPVLLTPAAPLANSASQPRTSVP